MRLILVALLMLAAIPIAVPTASAACPVDPTTLPADPFVEQSAGFSNSDPSIYASATPTCADNVPFCVIVQFGQSGGGDTRIKRCGILPW